ncbi:MAG: YlxM family DNA-binding protein [Clostridia bacterium]|jgi:predicted DNA-binding protein YlxM (UPF0122 family)|nr:YlxM family DNA-binding protein [Clostridia bacterium]
MDELTRRTLLFDFYGPLLTGKQQEIFDLYYQQDLSLGEIAENHGISRPAVLDMLRRAEESLNKYEKKLSLVERYVEYRHLLEELRTKIAGNGMDKQDSAILLNLLNKLEEHW